MAIPSFRSRANKNKWDSINKQREEANKSQEENKQEEVVSQEEHDKRVEMLKSLGILKE
jgi:hypothetical protein